MIRLVVLLVLTSCAHAPRNEAVTHARAMSVGAACVAMSTAQDKQPDIAICDIGHVIAYCYSGGGLGAGCIPFADFRAKPQAPKAEPAKPEPKADESEAPKPEAEAK